MTTSAPDTDGAVDDELRASRADVVRRVLLPRGLETTSKWMLLPVGALVAVCARADLPNGSELLQLALLWFVVEQLAYQARYQLNDLRDRRADAAHPASAQRGRLAFPWTPARAALVWGSVALRVGLAVALVALVLDGRPQQAGATLLVLVVPVSAAYELARERVRRERVDPLSRRARSLGLPVLLCVPLGYGLRVWTGLHALAPGDSGAGLAVLLVAAVLVLYAGTVLLAWALEGTSFVLADGTLRPGLGDRAHLALLVRHTGLLDHSRPTHDRPDATGLVLARDRPSRGPLDLKVWDLTGALGLLLAYAAAVHGADGDASTRAAAALAGLTSVVLPLLLRARLSRAPGPWDQRAPWLGGGALAATVGLEVGALVLLAAAVLLQDPGQARLLWLPAFFLFQHGALRTSSYVRGFGPFSLVKRPLVRLRNRGTGAERGARAPRRADAT